MAERIDFEEVESGNSGASETGREVIDVPEDVLDRQDEIHCYLVFSEDVSVEEGIEIVSQKVSNEQELTIERTDTGGNAIVVILTPKQYKEVSELPEVKSIKVIEEAELTENALPENASEENESTGVIEKESEVGGLATEYSTEEFETEEMTTESLTGSTTDSQKTYADGNAKELRIVAIVVILIVLLVIYVQQKRR